MTEPTTPAAAPAGWYPSAPGSPELRWWDGTQWTNHSHTLGVDSGQALTAPAGTSSNTVWIWIFAILPLAQLAEIPFLASFYDRLAAVGLTNTEALRTAEMNPGSGYLILQAIGLLVYAIWVVIAVVDYNVLKSRGVVRPFHWAWTFLSAWVYAIGRAVVAHRRTGSGYAPMGVFIASAAISVIGVLVVVFSFVAEVVQTAGS